MAPINYENILPGFLLLFLAISGDFIGDKFSCIIKNTLRNNYIYKNILLFLLIYFTLYFCETTSENPLASFIKALVIYIFCLFYVKQLPVTLIITLALLVAAFVAEQYKDHQQVNDYKINETVIDIIQIVAGALTLIITLIGFCIYYVKINKNKTQKIKFFEYMFGGTGCKGISTTKTGLHIN